MTTPDRDGGAARIARLANELYAGGAGARLPDPNPPAPLAAAAEPAYYFLGALAPDGAGAAAAEGGLDLAAIRRQFPALDQEVHGRPLVWLDSAATTHKPRVVIDRVADFYRRDNSNVHRGAHTLAARATEAYEGAREEVRRFLGAGSAAEVVFVRGATEAINLAAQAWGRGHVHAGDEIVVSELEHHSNIVPWQLLCSQTGARLRVAPIDERGEVRLDAYRRLLGPRTRLVALAQVSNALGTVLPLEEMIALARRAGACVLVDGAQGVSHRPVDVAALGCDFYAFSGHKVFGPTGIGVLHARPERLAEMLPWQGGGSMIDEVTFEHSTYQPPPARFEAGTGDIAGAVGLGAALAWLGRVGLERVERHERALLEHATEELARVPGLRFIGAPAVRAGVISFVIAGHPPEAIGAALDREGIAVRAGHHCAQPALRHFGLAATVRPSFALYNDHGDVDALATALRRLTR